MPSHGSNAAFTYHEPSIATILNLAGFLVVLNVVNVCLNKILYCGLLGQLFIGILWGTPGAKWLDHQTETVVQQLGYLGLIMLVYEGGLSTSIKSVKANLIISLCVAVTGIGVPMGLSFILKELASANSLQAFTAGAALSATSLGTTFTILSTTNLIATRLGTVTTSAAMLDDVVGLVMVQIILNLGGSDSSFSAVTVIRPIFVSIGFAVGLLLLCTFCLKPMLKKVHASKLKTPDFMKTTQSAFIFHTIILVGNVAGATYAGTSNLFAAYLAGVIVSWFDGLVAEFKVSDNSATSSDPQAELSSSNCNTKQNDTHNHSEDSQVPSSNEMPTKQSSSRHETPTGEKVYEKYYKDPVNRILIPLFFASIGFAIPITAMFKGKVVWRGIIYSLLMIFGKLITGLWLVRFSSNPVSNLTIGFRELLSRIPFCSMSMGLDRRWKEKRQTASKGEDSCQSSEGCRRTSKKRPTNRENTNKTENNARAASGENPSNQHSETQETSQTTMPKGRSPMALPPKPKSLYPPSILGLAMVARGEIGYLIASLAQSQGIFGNKSSGEISEIYLIIIWAISICTLISPICVGTLVKRVKRLQLARANPGDDPLGVWGI